MKTAALTFAFVCSVLLAIPAHAQQTQQDSRPGINYNNESSLKGATPSDFMPPAQQEKLKAQKASNYVSAEYYRSKKIASYVVVIDACVQAGLLPPQTISQETKYNLYIDREKGRPDPYRPKDLVTDEQVADAMHRALEDARKKFQKLTIFRDETHCKNFETMWTPLAKKNGFDDSSDIGSIKP